MNAGNVLAWLVLLVGVPLDVFTAIRIARWYRARPNPVVRERVVLSIAVLLVVLIFGVIFVNNDLPAPYLTGETTKIITRGAVLALSIVAAVYWLRLYPKGPA